MHPALTWLTAATSFQLMPMLQLLATLPTVMLSTGPWEPGCVPGFCPLPIRLGPPPGLMFLALGLVAAGVGGMWSRRSMRCGGGEPGNVGSSRDPVAR